VNRLIPLLGLNKGVVMKLRIRSIAWLLALVLVVAIPLTAV